ncbi:hypothetical protein FOB22_000904 [Saccharomyces cerevisiae]|nr:hypothetical protein FOB22_000904 [Saccharomyces cerevisiae]
MFLKNAVKNGLLATSARTILENIEFLPNHDGRTRIALYVLIIAFIISTFLWMMIMKYRMRMMKNQMVKKKMKTRKEEDVDDSETIQMFDIGDLDEPFLPMPSDD